MPRKIPPPRKAYPGLAALRLQSARREAIAARRDHHAREAAHALRKATPDWVELDRELKRYRLEAEMEAMEACLEAQKPDIPILNFDLMPGFEPPKKVEPEEHPDVAESRRVEKARADHDASVASNQNHLPPPDGKAWKYESDIEGYHPADDWRNYE